MYGAAPPSPPPSCIQLARAFGATTIVAVDVSDAKLERCLSLGATHVINAAAEDVVEGIKVGGGMGRERGMQGGPWQLVVGIGVGDGKRGREWDGWDDMWHDNGKEICVLLISRIRGATGCVGTATRQWKFCDRVTLTVLMLLSYQSSAEMGVLLRQVWPSSKYLVRGIALLHPFRRRPMGGVLTWQLRRLEGQPRLCRRCTASEMAARQ